MLGTRVTFGGLLVLGALVSIALGGPAPVAAQVGADGVIHGCVTRKSGKLRIVAAGSACTKREDAIGWNQVGPPGSNATLDGVAAGGALAGTYPDPTLRDGAVTIRSLQAGTWGLGTDLPPIAPHSCWASAITDVPQSPLVAGDLAVPVAFSYPDGLFPVPTVAPADKKQTLVICNGTDATIDAPYTSTNFRLAR